MVDFATARTAFADANANIEAGKYLAAEEKMREAGAVIVSGVLEQREGNRNDFSGREVLLERMLSPGSLSDPKYALRPDASGSYQAAVAAQYTDIMNGLRVRAKGDLTESSLDRLEKYTQGQTGAAQNLQNIAVFAIIAKSTELGHGIDELEGKEKEEAIKELGAKIATILRDNDKFFEFTSQHKDSITATLGGAMSRLNGEHLARLPESENRYAGEQAKRNAEEQARLAVETARIEAEAAAERAKIAQAERERIAAAGQKSKERLDGALEFFGLDDNPGLRPARYECVDADTSCKAPGAGGQKTANPARTPGT